MLCQQKQKESHSVTGVICPRSITPNLDSLSEHTGWKAATHGRIPIKITEIKKNCREGLTSMTILWQTYSGVIWNRNGTP